jgi:hypothetical protein
VHAEPAAEGGRAAPDVDRDVEHLALDRAHQLALRSADLRVQAAQRPAHRVRVVVLHEGTRDAAGAVLVEVVRLHEEAARVAVHVRLHDDHARQRGLQELHRPAASSSTICSRYCPYSLCRIERATFSTSSAR